MRHRDLRCDTVRVNQGPRYARRRARDRRNGGHKPKACGRRCHRPSMAASNRVERRRILPGGVIQEKSERLYRIELGLAGMSPSTRCARSGHHSTRFKWPATSEARRAESSGAEGGIRTPTLLRAPAPQAGASASSATSATRGLKNARARQARTCEYTVPGRADPRDGLVIGRYFFGGYFASSFFASSGSFRTSFDPVPSSSR